jgi:hypothetical protein
MLTNKNKFPIIFYLSGPSARQRWYATDLLMVSFPIAQSDFVRYRQGPSAF